MAHAKEEACCMHVFELPYYIRKPLTDTLDLNSAWELLAAKMGYSATDVLQFRKAALVSQNYSDILLTVWGSRGHRNEQLLNLLMKIDQASAVEFLLPVVSNEAKEKARCWLAERHALQYPLSDKSSVFSDAQVVIFSADSIPNSLVLEGSHLSSSSKPSEKLPCPENSSFEPKSNADYCSVRNCKSCVRRSISSSSGCPVDPLIAISMHNTLRINYDDLNVATDQFSAQNIIGHGGYGVVYKGNWKHTLVAVKRLGVMKLADGRVIRKQSSAADNEGFRQSMAELKTLALCRHDNILPLYGYCFDGTEYCVVYQFMSGGSLDDRLFDKGKLGSQPISCWQRLRIARGTACGLNYLHTCSKEPVIHGDIKPANILLDSCCEPKLGDFGLCRRGFSENSCPPLIVSHVKGTLAYLPPEFLQSKILTTKLDVYSFGMVFLELASGLKAYSDFRKPSNLAEFLKEERSKLGVSQFSALADVKMQDSADFWESVFEVLAELGFRCTVINREERPAVCEIIDVLDDKIKYLHSV